MNKGLGDGIYFLKIQNDFFTLLQSGDPVITHAVCILTTLKLLYNLFMSGEPPPKRKSARLGLALLIVMVAGDSVFSFERHSLNESPNLEKSTSQPSQNGVPGQAAPPIFSPVEKELMQEIGLYKKELDRIRQGSKAESLELLWAKAVSIVNTLIHFELRELKKNIEQKFEGCRLYNPEHGLYSYVALDLIFFRQLADQKGLADDKAFFDLLFQTKNSGEDFFVRPFKFQKEGYDGRHSCTNYDADMLINIYGDWKKFQQEHKSAYVELSSRVIQDIGDQLMKVRRPCGSEDEFHSTLQAFLNAYPNSGGSKWLAEFWDKIDRVKDYSNAVEKIKTSEEGQSLQPLWKQAKTLARYLNGCCGTGFDVMTFFTKSMPGFHAQGCSTPDCGTKPEYEPAFFKNLAEQKGGPADQAFFSLISEMGGEPSDRLSQINNDGSICSDYILAADLYRKWDKFQSDFGPAYHEYVRDHIGTVMDVFASTSKPCNDSKKVLESLESLAKDYPALSLKIRIEDIKTRGDDAFTTDYWPE